MKREISTPQWYSVTIPAAECGTRAAILKNDFETLYTINGTPNGAALFTSHGNESELFYFSPGAVAIAGGLIQHFSGQPCSAPVEDAGKPLLLVGHADERDILLRSAENPKPRLRRKIDQILGRE